MNLHSLDILNRYVWKDFTPQTYGIFAGVNDNDYLERGKKVKDLLLVI